jgi:hypothetical protein
MPVSQEHKERVLAHQEKQAAAPSVERELADLIAQYFRLQIGVLMNQAERHAANNKPLAVHHRLRKADAYYQVVALFERNDAFEAIRNGITWTRDMNLGAYPPSKELSRYRDPGFVVTKLLEGRL